MCRRGNKHFDVVFRGLTFVHFLSKDSKENSMRNIVDEKVFFAARVGFFRLQYYF